jgi:hypothetical protein
MLPIMSSPHIMSVASPIKETSFAKDKQDKNVVNLDLEGMMATEMSTPLVMARNCAVASVCALIAGSLIDNCIRAMQPLDEKEKPKRKDAALFFLVQLCMNIGFIIFLNHVSKQFIPWLQVSSSGWMFSVLVFTVQDRFVKNTISITSFDTGQ